MSEDPPFQPGGPPYEYDDRGRHVVRWGDRVTAHKLRLCRIEVCGRAPGRSNS